MIKFNLDKNVGLTIYEQLKGQLFSAIYCGKITAGDRLPSIRELAEELTVNYKTIRKAYQRLAEENFIQIVPGSGSFLQERSGADTYERMRHRAIYKLLGETIDKAQNLGLSEKKLLKLLDAHINSTNLRQIHLAVVDHEEEAFIFSRELEARLGAAVSAVSLNRIGSNGVSEELAPCDYLLTTSWHLDEVKEAADQLQKSVIEIKPSSEIYADILAAAQNQNVAIVVQDERTMHASWDVFMNIFYPSTDKKFWIAPIDRSDLIENILEEADTIFVSPMCWDEVRKRAPARKDLRTYEYFISQETIDEIRLLQLLG